MSNLGFPLYLLFTTSWFLHLSARIPALGTIRFDLLLVLVLTGLVFFKPKKVSEGGKIIDTENIINVLIIYVLVTIPFVEWPGSVIKTGIPTFIKAVVFYYFTIIFVTSEKKLKIFIAVFLVCQTVRVVEPLFLHITEGYWGAATYAQGQFMDRLAGGPYDIVNPNGLAYIIVSVIPFYYFLATLSWKNKVIFALGIPAFIYALILTSSRSGILGLIIILCGLVIKSKHRLVLGIVMSIAVIVVLFSLDPSHQERYLSIIDPNTSHSLTAQSRFDGLKTHLMLALKKPIFGHGLSTSIEVNYQYTGEALIAHNLYIEVAQELGFVGLAIFLLFMRSIIVNFSQSYRTFKDNLKGNDFLLRITDAMQVWMWMNILFSFASFGLSSYAWYLFAGLSVVLLRLSSQVLNDEDVKEQKADTL